MKKLREGRQKQVRQTAPRSTPMSIPRWCKSADAQIYYILISCQVFLTFHNVTTSQNNYKKTFIPNVLISLYVQQNVQLFFRNVTKVIEIGVQSVVHL